MSGKGVEWISPIHFELSCEVSKLNYSETEKSIKQVKKKAKKEKSQRIIWGLGNLKCL